MSVKTEETTKNRQSRGTGNRTHRTKTNKNKKTQHRKIYILHVC